MVNLPSFVKRFTDDGLTLCKGVQSNSIQMSKTDVLVDYLDEKIVTRSKRCKFALASDEGPVSNFHLNVRTSASFILTTSLEGPSRLRLCDFNSL